MKILIKGTLLGDNVVDILVDGNRFAKIGGRIDVPEIDEIIDGAGTAILPPFYNAHTHAAMTLLRGYADDMELFKWLNEYIWPFEDKLTAEDIFAGSRLAILEMIRSGTVFFNDMYWETQETIRAAESMGVRSAIGMVFTDVTPKERVESNLDFIKKFRRTELTQITIAPHAIYTASEGLLRRCAELARERGLLLHTHLAETQKEVADCVKEHGKSPTKYLDDIGFLGSDVVAAHCVCLDDNDVEILQRRGVTIAHNPAANMKLGSGIFRAAACDKAGCKIALGTDGPSSNNNLDMGEEMKFAALLAKVSGTPEDIPAQSVFRWATSAGAEAFGIDAGVIAEGKLADALLVDLSDTRFVPNHNLISNWVYSADRHCIRDVICNGKILMRNRVVAGEDEIVEAARNAPCLKKSAQRRGA